MVPEIYSYITDVTGARPTGSNAHKQAADYMRAKLAEWGLANSHLEPFQFGRGWDLQKFSLELTAPRYFPMNGYPQAWTPSPKGVLSGSRSISATRPPPRSRRSAKNYAARSCCPCRRKRCSTERSPAAGRL